MKNQHARNSFLYIKLKKTLCVVASKKPSHFINRSFLSHLCISAQGEKIAPSQDIL
jgi:hypothetical protein